jgi:hypothetical protein
MCADLLLSGVLPTYLCKTIKQVHVISAVCLSPRERCYVRALHVHTGETSSTPEYCEKVTLLSLDLEAMSCSCKLQRFLRYFSISGICEDLLAHESSSLFVVRSSTNAVINK